MKEKIRKNKIISTKPLLQVALDYTDLVGATEMLNKIKNEVDIVEAGTPLLKSEGLKNVLPAFREITKKPLVADLKVADVADIEFEVAAANYAKYVTVLASSPLENIKDGLESARKNNMILVADLLGVENYCSRAQELVHLGVPYIGLHCGISEQRHGKNIFTKTREVSEAITGLDGKIVVAGGINNDNIDQLAGIQNIAIIIVGGGITRVGDPVGAAKSLKNKINSIF